MGIIKKLDLSDKDFIEIFTESNSMHDFYKRLGYSSGKSVAVDRRIAKLELYMPKYSNKKHRKPDSEVFTTGIYVDNSYLRSRYLEDSNIDYCCVMCGNKGEWLGVTIPLELDHISGDRLDNRKVNLRWLCPNCHSTTPTYGAKNKNRGVATPKRNYGTSSCVYCNKDFTKKTKYQKYCSTHCANKCQSGKPPIEKEQLYDLLKNHNFTYVGSLYGVSDNAVRKWCVKLGIPDKASAYR